MHDLDRSSQLPRRSNHNALTIGGITLLVLVTLSLAATPALIKVAAGPTDRTTERLVRSGELVQVQRRQHQRARERQEIKPIDAREARGVERAAWAVLPLAPSRFVCESVVRPLDDRLDLLALPPPGDLA